MSMLFCLHPVCIILYICEDMCILLCTLVADKSVQIRFKLWKMIYFAGHVQVVSKPEAERTHKVSVAGQKSKCCI